MTKHEQPLAFSRRALLQAGGALVISIGAPIAFESVQAAENAMLTGAQPPLTPDQLSSYIAVKSDGTIAAYFGKMDMGPGVDVAIAQIVAEELDVSFERVSVVMGDRARRDGVHRHPKGRHRRPVRRCRRSVSSR